MPTPRRAKTVTSRGGEKRLHYENMPSSGPGKLLCEVCGKSFHHSGVLGRHRSLHKNKKSSVKSLVNPRTLTCSACSKKFVNRRALNCHCCTKSKPNLNHTLDSSVNSPSKKGKSIPVNSLQASGNQNVSLYHKLDSSTNSPSKKVKSNPVKALQASGNQNVEKNCLVKRVSTLRNRTKEDLPNTNSTSKRKVPAKTEVKVPISRKNHNADNQKVESVSSNDENLEGDSFPCKILTRSTLAKDAFSTVNSTSKREIRAKIEVKAPICKKNQNVDVPETLPALRSKTQAKNALSIENSSSKSKPDKIEAKVDVKMKIKTQHVDMQETLEVMSSNNKNLIPCKVCKKLFQSEAQLEQHATLHDPKKPFGCDICGKFFDDARFVKTHRLLHEKKSRKECDVCGKVFDERIFFDIHCLTHVDQKPFRCDVCEDIFKDKTTFARHYKSHTDITKKVAKRFLGMKEVLKQKLEESNRNN